MWFCVISVITCVLASSAHAQLFQCRPSENDAYGQVFPNIPDTYFNSAEAANSLTGPIPDLTALVFSIVYVFVVPQVGPNRDCSGNVMAIEYCYRTLRTIGNGQKTVFEFLLLTRNTPISIHGQRFTVDSRFPVRDNPATATCTDIAGTVEKVCCSTTDLSEANQHEAPTTAYTIGIAVTNANILPLAFSFSSTAFNFNQYQIPLSNVHLGGSITVNQLTGRSLALLRFNLAPAPVPMTVPAPLTTTTTELLTPQPVTPESLTSTAPVPPLTTQPSPVTSEPNPATSESNPATSEPNPATSEPNPATSEPNPATSEPNPATSEPTSVPATSVQTTSTSDTTEPVFLGDNNNDASVGLGVSFGFMLPLLLAVLIVCACVVIVVILKRRSSWKLGPLSSRVFGMSINNDVYETGETPQDYETIDYAGEGPNAYNVNRSEYEQPMTTLKYAYAGAGVKDDTSKSSTWKSENIYMTPGSDVDTLYGQLNEIQTSKIPRRAIRLGDPLASGHFGMVCEGVMNSSAGEDVDVAVKMLKEGSDKQDRVKFLQEAAIMGQFKHPHVVTMYGVVTEGEPVLLVLELLSKGDLKKHLLHMKSGENIDDHTLLSFCRQVASGMTYLSSKAFVHRDLAARNVLLTDKLICKIADFGMSRDLMDESYYVARGGKIPIKWTAPEALHYKKYSTASDVWSYGALVYEIWSMGHKPYGKFSNAKVLQLVDTGFRLPPPPGCPRALYSIMISCWHPATAKRPSFADISTNLSLPDSELLKWSEVDKSTHPGADKLGADLLLAQDLYKDLQVLYKN